MIKYLLNKIKTVSFSKEWILCFPLKCHFLQYVNNNNNNKKLLFLCNLCKIINNFTKLAKQYLLAKNICVSLWNLKSWINQGFCTSEAHKVILIFLYMNLISVYVLRVTDTYLPTRFFFSFFLKYLRAFVCRTLCYFKRRCLTWPWLHTSCFLENHGYHNSAGIS